MDLDADLSSALAAAARLPQAEGKIAFQVVPVQLRAWVVDQDDVVCRPYYLAVLELYPRGKVLSARIASPASRRPDARALLDFLLAHISDPPAGEPRRRPTHVSFTDGAVVDACGPALKRLEIVCGFLTLADGVRDYVATFSDKLVKMERASRGDSAEQPGLLSVAGVTAESAGGLMRRAVGMYRAEPWAKVRESLSIEAVVPSMPGGKVRKLRYYVSVLGSGGKVVGFAVMASLEALREKWKRSTEGAMGDLSLGEDDEEEQASPEAKLGELLCAHCGHRVGETAEEDGCKYVHRCGACQRLLYCDEQCQKLDWGRRHREECSSALADKDFVFRRDEWTWLRRELALLFVDPTSVPFDDLDAGEEHGWPSIEDASPPLYPIAFVTIEGPGGSAAGRRVDRPTAEEVHTLTLLATALTECSAPPPAGGEILLPNGVVLRVAEDLAAPPKR